MIILLSGAVYGQINRFYDKVLQIEKEIGAQADWVLQTGNFGVYPDPDKISATMREREIPGDFAKIYINGEGLPRPTLFVPGKHEDHLWLERKISRSDLQLIPNLTLLQNGFKTHIGQNDDDVSVVGLGKVYSSKTYQYGRGKSKKRLSHYTRAEVERACAQGPTDILLLHEPPNDAKGIKNACFATRPRLVLHNKRTSKNRTSIRGGIIVALGELDIEPILWEESGYKFLLD